MQEVFLDSHKIYATLAGARTDITAYVVGEIAGGGWGIMGNGTNDRVGATGSLDFTLNDADGRFTPYSATALAGWDIGVVIELECTFEGSAYLFRFYVKKIDPPQELEDTSTEVSCVDYMEQAATTPIENPGVLADKTGDQILTTATALINTPPLATSFDTGDNVFPTAFDTTTSHTTVYDEIVKVVFSELGYGYLIKDRTNGETLRFENASARVGYTPLSTIPLDKANSPRLKEAFGSYLKRENGDLLLIAASADAVFDNEFERAETSYGDHLLNRLTMQANPRRIDTTPQILFQSMEPFVIGSGQTYILRGTYADPAGGAQINANPDDMIDPAITTDYLGNTAQDGSGTNISSDLFLSSISYGTEGFTHALRNDNSASMWVTKFNCRGLGIYNYNPITHVASDSASILKYRNTFSETVDQKYKVDLYEAAVFAEAEVERGKQARLALNAIHLCANYSARNMLGFLNTKPGALINVKFDRAGIDGNFYIQGIDEVSISQDGKIFYKWILKESRSFDAGLTPIVYDGGVGEANGVDFGYVPRVLKPRARTFSIWFNTTDVNGSSGGMFFSTKTAAGGFHVAMRSTNNIFLETMSWDGGTGSWYTADNTYTANAWHLLTVPYDTTLVTNDPVVYIDGVAKSLTEFATPSGAYVEEVSNFVLGNTNRIDDFWGSGFKGTLFDMRVYNRILSAAEVTALYTEGRHAGTPTLTDGLVFQAFGCDTSRLTEYINQTLISSTPIIDNVSGIVGAPHGSPTGRAL